MFGLLVDIQFNIGEVLVFYLPIRFFYYLANLIIFTRSSRIPCIFFLEGGFKGIYLREKNFTLSYVVSEIWIFEGSAPTFHGGSPRNSLQSDVFLFGPGTFIYHMNAAYFLYVMPDMSLPPQKWSAFC